MQQCILFNNMYTYKDWEKYFHENSVAEPLKQQYLKYIALLLSNNVPIVFEMQHLSLLLGLKRNLLFNIINSSDSFYRTFSIQKRSGGEREISAPYPILQYLQKWILDNILNKATIHDNSYAYTKGRSIITNAKQHLNCKEMLSIDITDFFGSINKRRVISVFKGFGYTNLLSYYLASLCCNNDKLPQGACTSPILSNIVAKRLDLRFTSLANKMNINYTRYADDITFSGNKIPSNLLSICRTILTSEGFSLNEKKIKFKPCGAKKVVTGLNVHNENLTVQKQYKRNLRKEIHYIKKFGILNHLDHINDLDPMYLDRLIGRFNFVLSVEPDNKFAVDSLNFLMKNLK